MFIDSYQVTEIRQAVVACHLELYKRSQKKLNYLARTTRWLLIALFVGALASSWTSFREFSPWLFALVGLLMAAREVLLRRQLYTVPDDHTLICIVDSHVRDLQKLDSLEYDMLNHLIRAACARDCGMVEYALADLLIVPPFHDLQLVRLIGQSFPLTIIPAPK